MTTLTESTSCKLAWQSEYTVKTSLAPIYITAKRANEVFVEMVKPKVAGRNDPPKHIRAREFRDDSKKVQ